MYPSVKKMIIDMELKGFSEQTVRTYSKHVIRIAEFYSIQPELLDSNHIREYLHHTIAVRNLSRAYVNIAYSAFKFFFTITLMRSWDMNQIPRTKLESKWSGYTKLDSFLKGMYNKMNRKGESPWQKENDVSLLMNSNIKWCNYT